MALYLLFDKLIYLIVPYLLLLFVISILACIIPILYIVGLTGKSVVKTKKYLVALIIVLLASGIFFLKTGWDFSHSIKTVSYRVEDYRIKNYKGKACYFLKTNDGIKVVAKDSIKLEESDKKADKKHPAGTVITYKQVVLKNNIPEYRHKWLQSTLEDNNRGSLNTIKPVPRNELVRINYR